jgi:hypothetical protein
MEKDIHVSQKGQGAATNREKGQGVTRTRAGAAPCKNGLARTLKTDLIFSQPSPTPPLIQCCNSAKNSSCMGTS